MALKELGQVLADLLVVLLACVGAALSSHILRAQPTGVEPLHGSAALPRGRKSPRKPGTTAAGTDNPQSEPLRTAKFKDCSRSGSRP